MVTMTPAHLSEAHPFAYKMRHFFEVARDVIYESAEERREEQIPWVVASLALGAHLCPYPLHVGGGQVTGEVGHRVRGAAGRAQTTRVAK